MVYKVFKYDRLSLDHRLFRLCCCVRETSESIEQRFLTKGHNQTNIFRVPAALNTKTTAKTILQAFHVLQIKAVEGL